MSSLRSFKLNKQLFNPALYNRIQTLWFGDIPANATGPTEAASKKWFYNPDKAEREAFDNVCRADFAPALESISSTRMTLPPALDFKSEQDRAHEIAAPFLSEIQIGETQTEATAASNALSLVLLLDQMSRNIFRNDQAAIYAHYDRISRALFYCIFAGSPRLDKNATFQLRPIFATWMYMPLMHSEHRDDHLLYDEHLQAMRDAAKDRGDEDGVKWLENGLDYDKRHFDIIKQFGRYPYRNSVLGRKTTPQEEEWLEAGGETFGA